MEKHIQLIPTKDMSRQDWLDYRQTGVGASEVGTVLGLNPYQSSVELFYKKIGFTPIVDIDNSAMFWGRELEAQVCDKWQYWAGDEESMIENFKAEKLIRKCQRVNAYIRNPKFPWLFVSLDRKILASTNGGEEAALEAKTISGYTSNMWESGIPPQYVVQLQTQLLVCEFNSGEMALLKDGRNMSVIPFVRHEEIINGIIQRTEAFWQRCVKGKELMAEYRKFELASDIAGMEQTMASIGTLEPEPDGSEAYENFLSSRFKGGKEQRDGTVEEFKLAKEHNAIKEQISTLEEIAREKTNRLKASIGDFDCVDFMAAGKITWKANKNGTRVFKNSVKVIE